MTGPQAGRQGRPTWIQGLLIVGAGIVLGVGGCAAFIVGLDWNSDVVSFMGGLAFLSALPTIVVGGVRFIVGVVKALASK